MSKLDLMKVVDDRAPYPSRLHVKCAHLETDAIVSIQAMHVSMSDLPAADREYL